MAQKTLLPPIIGEVSSNQCVILLESNVTIYYRLLNDHAMVVQSGKVEPIEDTIMRHVLSDLKPNTSYTIHWSDSDQDESLDLRIINEDEMIPNSNFQTQSEEGPRKFALISCDLPPMQGGPNLWRAIPDYDPDMVLHIGDNVYMDSQYKLGVRLARRGLFGQTTNLFRRVYRRTWSRPDTYHIWSNYSNLCIGDDHEFHNKYPGPIPARDREGFSICQDLYLKYQMGLQLDSPHHSAPVSDVMKNTCFSRQWGDLLVIMVEFISLPSQESFLQLRWPEILETIVNSDATKVLLVLTKALLPMSRGFASHFITPEFQTEHLRCIYDDISNWLVEDSERRIQLVFGDMHLGAIGHIERMVGDRAIEIPFVLSSPITNYPSPYESLARRAMIASRREVGIYTVEYDRITCRRNFAMVELVDGEFEVELILGTGQRPTIANLIRGLRWLL